MGYVSSLKGTLPETNNSITIAPVNSWLVDYRHIFRCYVSFRDDQQETWQHELSPQGFLVWVNLGWMIWLPLWKVTFPLEINGRKMGFPFQMVPSYGRCSFSGVYVSYLHTLLSWINERWKSRVNKNSWLVATRCGWCFRCRGLNQNKVLMQDQTPNSSKSTFFEIGNRSGMFPTY